MVLPFRTRILLYRFAKRYCSAHPRPLWPGHHGNTPKAIRDYDYDSSSSQCDITRVLKCEISKSPDHHGSISNKASFPRWSGQDHMNITCIIIIMPKLVYFWSPGTSKDSALLQNDQFINHPSFPIPVYGPVTGPKLARALPRWGSTSAWIMSGSVLYKMEGWGFPLAILYKENEHRENDSHEAK